MKILKQTGLFLEHVMQLRFTHSEPHLKTTRGCRFIGPLRDDIFMIWFIPGFMISIREKKEKPIQFEFRVLLRIPSPSKSPGKPSRLPQIDLRARSVAWLASMTVPSAVTNACSMFYSRNHRISSLFGFAGFEASLCYPLASSGFAKHASLWWSLSRQKPLYPRGQYTASQQFK